MAVDLLDPEPLTTLPERYEVLNGVVVECKPMSAYAAEVANCVRDLLAEYGRATAGRRRKANRSGNRSNRRRANARRRHRRRLCVAGTCRRRRRRA